jgi:hypothetical protein
MTAPYEMATLEPLSRACSRFIASNGRDAENWHLLTIAFRKHGDGQLVDFIEVKDIESGELFSLGTRPAT